MSNEVTIELDRMNVKLKEFETELNDRDLLVQALKNKLDLYQDPIVLKKWIIRCIQESADNSNFRTEAAVDDLREATKESFAFVKDQHLTIPDIVGENNKYKTLGEYIMAVEKKIVSNESKLKKYISE